MSAAPVDDLIPCSAHCCTISSLFFEWPACFGCANKGVCCCIENESICCKFPVAGVTPEGVSNFFLDIQIDIWMHGYSLYIFTSFLFQIYLQILIIYSLIFMFRKFAWWTCRPATWSALLLAASPPVTSAAATLVALFLVTRRCRACASCCPVLPLATT